MRRQTAAEAVRSRAAMYIGPVTGAAAVERLIVESVAFLLSDALPGRPRRIEVLLTPAGLISITDARPKATEAQRRGLRAWLSVLVTTLHAGIEHDHPSIGELHGVGVPVVNFLSANFKISFNYGGRSFSRTYERGKPLGDFESRGSPVGTVLSFTPDTSILGAGSMNAVTVLRRLARARAVVPVVVRKVRELPK